MPGTCVLEGWRVEWVLVFIGGGWRECLVVGEGSLGGEVKKGGFDVE